MEEEVTQKTIALSIKSAKLTSDVLKTALRKFLNGKKQKGHNPYNKGKQTVKELVGQNAGVSNIEIDDGNIKSFERVAKKYGVDYAIKKDKTQYPSKYIVFFKGRDSEVLDRAFKEFLGKHMKQNKKPSIKEKLVNFKDVVSKGMNRERKREQQKDRGQGR